MQGPRRQIRSTLTRRNCAAVKLAAVIGLLATAALILVWAGSAVLLVAGVLPPLEATGIVAAAGALGAVVAVGAAAIMDALRRSQLEGLDLAGPLAEVGAMSLSIISTAAAPSAPPPRLLT